jgi:orotidine-5'-phosphate decarboxylase
MNPLPRVFVALDFADPAKAVALAHTLDPRECGLKVGKELFVTAGPDPVRSMIGRGFAVFLDLKFHDIPNTVAGAMQAIHVLEPAIVTVHASGGRAMMEDAKAAAHPLTRVVAVTVLTSLDATDLGSIGVAGDEQGQVERLTALAREAGLDGVVCSGFEVAAARKAWRDGFFVVPGVRPAGGAVGDQKRVMTPRQALDNGASILVVGRPITRAEDPDAAARAIGATL